VAFALLFFLGDRRNILGLITGAACLAVLSGAALLWTGTSPENLVVNGLLSHRIGYMAQQDNAAGMWMAASGLDPFCATMVATSILALLAMALWIFARRHAESIALENAAALCAALGYAGFYHVHYDNMMLFPLLLALTASALRSGRLLLWAAAAVLAAICYTEPGFIVGHANTNPVVSWLVFLCPLATCAVLFDLRSQGSADAQTY